MKTTRTAVSTKAKYTYSSKYQKHFTLDERISIQKIISEHRGPNGELTIMLKNIGDMLQTDPSTISKEVKKHRIIKPRSYDNYATYNKICKHYESCTKRLFTSSKCFCKSYSRCIDHCVDFEEDLCPYLKKFPWVCNGCPKFKSCKKTKYVYYSDIADKVYREVLSESRQGINLTPDEFNELNHVVSTYVKAGQPIYHITMSNELPVCERTIYNYFERGILNAKNIDLRRKVVFKKRYKRKIDKTYLRKIKINRTYEDYQKYILNNPDASIVQMDTVIGSNDSHKVLLTLHFVKFHFQLAYILDSKEAINVNYTLDSICNDIGIDNFKRLFEVILTDNGTEFSNPAGIEFDAETGEQRSHVFFCHAYSSHEKGSCEKNHEYIRYVLPKGTSFEFLNQDLVNLMMSHINSTNRPSVKGTPYEFMALTYGTEVLDLLKIKKIDANQIILNTKLFK